MIRISDRQMESFEDAHARAFPARFHDWWKANVAPEATPHVTERLVFAHRDEFDLVGVREEVDQFLFLFARALMPNMGDREYLETMDAIMLRAPQSERMERLRIIASEYGHRG